MSDEKSRNGRMCWNFDHMETGIHDEGIPLDESCCFPFDSTWAIATKQPTWFLKAIEQDHRRNWGDISFQPRPDGEKS